MSTSCKRWALRMMLPAALVVGLGGAATPSAVAKPPKKKPPTAFLVAQGALDNFCEFTFTNGQQAEEYTLAQTPTDYHVFEKQPTPNTWSILDYPQAIVSNVSNCQSTPF